MIEERDGIIFYVNMIEIFDHFPDHTHVYMLYQSKYQKVRISQPKHGQQKNKEQVMLTILPFFLYVQSITYILGKEENPLGYT